METPEKWMARGPEAKPAEESVRAWYDRTTRRWRKALVWSTVLAVVGGAVLYSLASFTLLARLQTFNGAATIPVSALIWIVAFVYIFLVPNREVGFRSMEAIERMERRLVATIDEKVLPALAVWQKVGERVERELPGFLEEAREGIADAKAIAKKLEHVSEKNEKLAEDAKPTIEALRRISDRFQREIDTGLLDEARSAFESVRNLAGVPKDPTEPDLEKTLAALRRKKA